jgi:DNA-binding transcriptional regulator YiaG
MENTVLCGSGFENGRGCEEELNYNKDKIKEINNVIGENIKFFRTHKKISLRKLGKSLGITYQEISYYESGKRRVPASVLYYISKIFDYPIVLFYPK